MSGQVCVGCEARFVLDVRPGLCWMCGQVCVGCVARFVLNVRPGLC